MLLYSAYQSVGTVLYVLAFPFVLISSLLQRKRAHGLSRRFGFGLQKNPAKRTGDVSRVWIHAASVGEVQAAGALMREVRSREGKCDFFLSTVTKHGLEVASRQMEADVHCFLAPLDAPPAVRRFLAAIEPDVYACLETELWPAMFIELHKRGIPSVILNGRMTGRSCQRYRLLGPLLGRMLGSVKGLAVISSGDGRRFRELGAPEEAIQVTGNIKYDYPIEDIDAVRSHYRALLGAGREIVFICGSTRTGEEHILLRTFQALSEQGGREVLWVIAPRHMERLEAVKKILSAAGLKYDLFSGLKSSERTGSVVLVDTMGDLGRLYSAGDLNFVGGSLVKKRGHNLMEAARWGRPVYYGPSVEDFRDAADILEGAGGGFRAADGYALTEKLLHHLHNKHEYGQACANAAHAVSIQRGAAGRQADMLLNLLPGPGQKLRVYSS